MKVLFIYLFFKSWTECIEHELNTSNPGPVSISIANFIKESLSSLSSLGVMALETGTQISSLDANLFTWEFESVQLFWFRH